MFASAGNRPHSTDADKQVCLSPYLCYCFLSYTSSCANPNLAQHKSRASPQARLATTRLCGYVVFEDTKVLEYLAKSPEGAAL